MPYKLTLKEMIQDRERKSLIEAQGRIPKFVLNEEIRVTKKEPDLGRWSHMDDIRKARQGEIGVVINREVVDPEKDEEFRGKGLSCFVYTIRFRDGKIICFSEEHLKKIRKKA